MIKILKILKEEYGGKIFKLPPEHQAGLKVPKGGSCCANCKYWTGNSCSNNYYQQWSGTNKIPYSPDEYCSDWWTPKN